MWIMERIGLKPSVERLAHLGTESLIKKILERCVATSPRLDVIDEHARIQPTQFQCFHGLRRSLAASRTYSC